jgi:hypothetical protein
VGVYVGVGLAVAVGVAVWVGVGVHVGVGVGLGASQPSGPSAAQAARNWAVAARPAIRRKLRRLKGGGRSE